MTYAHAIVLLSALSVAACTAQLKPTASESDVLAATKRLSAQDCDPSMHPREEMVGCRYSAAFIEGEWQVLRVYEVEYHGERVGVSGGLIYIFDRTGNFVKVVGGM
jgi:hypothetical protein